ncbi:MAG: ornithine cyclodeaminase family protein [Acidobacteria bacterium]|nr:ornithine cyclodeaminase family protein [Acidobacteriota bacterium]
MAIYLTERDVAELLTMDDVLAAVEEAFRLQAKGDAVNESRRRVRAAGSVLQVMSGGVANFAEFKGLLGLKSYTVTRFGARFYVSLFSAETGELLAFIEADKLGQMRTGAASGIATKFLARKDARTVGIYGTGWQARTQLEAVLKVRSIETVLAYSRKPENREKFCAEMSGLAGGTSFFPVANPEEAAAADILITITSSREPVLLGEWLKPGAHINAAGGNSILRREIDDQAIIRSSLVTVDSIDQAKIEAGEFVSAVEKGLLIWERVRELKYVVSGDMQGRTSNQDITLFKSLGIAIEDITTAGVLYRKAVEQKKGREL